MNIEHKKGHGWVCETTVSLTDEQAMDLTFWASPAQVTLGEFVEIRDAGGVRIGHVKSATYHERAWGPAMVNVTIDLR